MFTEEQFNEMVAEYGYELTAKLFALRIVNATTIPTTEDLLGKGSFSARVWDGYERAMGPIVFCNRDPLLSLLLQTTSTFAARSTENVDFNRPLPELWVEYRAATIRD
jgi:hypothetical protein